MGLVHQYGGMTAASGVRTVAIGGSYAAGWAGGLVSGFVTGLGLGVAGNILKSALLVEETGVVATGSALLKSFAAAEAKTALYGTAGGAVGSAITQLIDQGTVNVDSAASAGIVNGTVAAFAAPYTIIPSGIGTVDTTSTIVNLIVTAINEIVADSSSATLSN